MTEPEQITEAEQLAVPVWMHRLAGKIVLGNHGVGNAGVLIQRAFEERLHIELAKHSLAENTAKATEAAQARGYKIDPRLVDLEDRAWTATRQDAPVTENSHDQ